ncbi:NAD(P)-binding protein [Candidatus Micrarchaeota archaeon]|nr:NAD(P)-binding protein [Candidatus Micrarchaeota archaeon]MBD3417894.1 NAD(P)-binding protein [Candidatus Micrarchaeota archaeon]
MAQVRVIGAGPSGSVAAVSALENGHTVSVFEEHERAGIPVNCSGLISREGLESLKGFIDYKKHAKNRMRGAIIDCAGSRLLVDSGKDIAYVIDRASFDDALAQKAETEGAKFHYGKRASPPFPEGHIIGADGPNSSVASYFGFPNISRFVGVSQCTVRYDGSMQDHVRVFLSNEKFPGFFAWLIPQNEEYAEAGAGCVLPGNPNRALDYLSRHTGTEFPRQRIHSIIPVARREKTFLSTPSRNILLVGDAAGHVKSTTGGGVVFGTHCARLAGRHIESPHDYGRECRKLHGRDLDAHYRLHTAMGRMSDDALRALGSIASTFRIEEFLQSNGNMDRPMKMLGPSLFLHPIRALINK